MARHHGRHHRPLRPPASDAPGSTLGANLRACRLGYGWVPELGAWLRLSPAGPHVRVDLEPDVVPANRTGMHWCWWEGDGTLDRQVLGRLAEIVAGDGRLVALRRGISFTIDDAGRVVTT